MKGGEGNLQAREEEGKTVFIKYRAQLSGWNYRNVGIGIPWESRRFHKHIYNSIPRHNLQHFPEPFGGSPDTLPPSKKEGYMARLIASLCLPWLPAKSNL